MKPINLHNYEAWFLDYVEGRLSAIEVESLQHFLTEHPELKAELDSFEPIVLPAVAAASLDWSGLKIPDDTVLRMDAQAREWLYFQAMEGVASQPEMAALDALTEDAEMAAEYSHWKNAQLKANSATLAQRDKDALYQFGLERPVSDFNFEAYLIAYAEGLLSPVEVDALSAFAEMQRKGQKALQLAALTRLVPPKGIFYPDKAGLYRKKELRFVPFWLQRAAAVLLLVAAGIAALWYFPSRLVEPNDSSIAEKSKHIEPKPLVPTLSADTLPELVINKHFENNTIERSSPMHTETLQNAPALAAKLLEKPQQDDVVPPKSPPTSPLPAPLLVEVPVVVFSEKDEIASIVVHEADAPEGALERTQASIGSVYLTVPELLAEGLAKQLNIETTKSDELALAFARRITEKAAEVLKTEIKRDEAADGEHLSYTFRVGNFKVEHTRRK